METKNKTKKGAPKSPRDAYLAKVGASRQFAIPKKVYDALALNTGDYLEIVIQDNCLLVTPKTLIEKRLAEGLKDITEGRVTGPFSTVDDVMESLTNNDV